MDLDLGFILNCMMQVNGIRRSLTEIGILKGKQPPHREEGYSPRHNHRYQPRQNKFSLLNLLNPQRKTHQYQEDLTIRRGSFLYPSRNTNHKRIVEQGHNFKRQALSRGTQRPKIRKSWLF